MLVVLAVEDDEQVRVLAESILKEEGYETLSANKGRFFHPGYHNHLVA